MRTLFLCDDGDPQKVVPLCRRYRCGIEVQGFYNPLLPENDPSAIDRHLSLLAGITPRSSHGCFGDLCPGSFDPLVRSVARNRFDLSYSVAKRLGANHLVLHLGYVHIHDNHGKEDEHLGLGAGTVALEEVLSLLQTESPRAIWALETQVEALEDSLEWLGNNGLLEAEAQG
jgi:sugar phosphate isomerase/epimerase